MKTGRNEACPCGSGKKYKKCCLGKAVAPLNLAQTYPSTRELKAQPGDPSPHLSAYSLAKLTENFDLQKLKPALRKQAQELAKVSWSRAKVAALSTEQIESQLCDYGVNYTRAGFLQLSDGMNSAWQLSEIWFSGGGLTCRGMDEDFVGLAACELWKRLLRERPSMEMVDDWLDQGYAVVNQDPGQACDFWWQAWRALHPRFRPQNRTLQATGEVFQGTYLLYNWCQDLELWLCNAALRERRFAVMGEQYCREWLAQFSGETSQMQVSFRRGWAEFTFRSGQVERARAILEETLEDFPKDPWSYVFLADAYSHLFADPEYHLPFDLEKANEYLQLGLRQLRGKQDRSVLQERLDGLAEAKPIWENLPPTLPKATSRTIKWP